MRNAEAFTERLHELSRGDRSVVDVLVHRVYDELRRLARRQLRRERPDHTFDTTDLVHEAYERLVRQDRVDWKNRAHFLGVASLAMRRILINYAHRRNAQKRGGDVTVVPFEEAAAPRTVSPEALIDLDDALRSLEQRSPRQARVVTCRFFGGLTHRQAAEVIGVSEATVRRDWRMARAYLSRALAPAEAPEAPKSSADPDRPSGTDGPAGADGPAGGPSGADR
jgi:RNA polymerase sigma factor (TIGR02999 family)